jgi:PEP-CTERM motif-containing protein
VGVNASSYTVYEFKVGSISNCGQGTCMGGLSYNNLAKGSVIISFLENGKGIVIEQNPNSDSITSGLSATPEPGSMALLGSGLALIGGYLRRYRRSWSAIYFSPSPGDQFWGHREAARHEVGEPLLLLSYDLTARPEHVNMKVVP